MALPGRLRHPLVSGRRPRRGSVYPGERHPYLAYRRGGAEAHDQPADPGGRPQHASQPAPAAAVPVSDDRTDGGLSLAGGDAHRAGPAAGLRPLCRAGRYLLGRPHDALSGLRDDGGLVSRLAKPGPDSYGHAGSGPRGQRENRRYAGPDDRSDGIERLFTGRMAGAGLSAADVRALLRAGVPAWGRGDARRSAPLHARLHHRIAAFLAPVLAAPDGPRADHPLRMVRLARAAAAVRAVSLRAGPLRAGGADQRISERGHVPGSGAAADLSAAPPAGGRAADRRGADRDGLSLALGDSRWGAGAAGRFDGPCLAGAGGLFVRAAVRGGLARDGAGGPVGRLAAGKPLARHGGCRPLRHAALGGSVLLRAVPVRPGLLPGLLRAFEDPTVFPPAGRDGGRDAGNRAGGRSAQFRRQPLVGLADPPLAPCPDRAAGLRSAGKLSGHAAQPDSGPAAPEPLSPRTAPMGAAPELSLVDVAGGLWAGGRVSGALRPAADCAQSRQRARRGAGARSDESRLRSLWGSPAY